MQWDKKALFKAILIPLAVGGIAGLLTGSGMKAFESLNQPPLSPPGWLFPIVWTILYVLMGIASYLVFFTENEENKFRALAVYVLQLIVNFFWPIFFFGFELYFFAFLWLLLLWVLILWTIREFRKINEMAAVLLLPYLLWVTFAGYLNFGIWWLNR